MTELYVPNIHDFERKAQKAQLRSRFFESVYIACLYWITLVYVYITTINPINGAHAYFELNFKEFKLFESFFIVAMLVPTTINHWNRPSHFCISVLYFIGLVPTAVIYGLADQPRYAMYTMVAGYLAVVITTQSAIFVPKITISYEPRYAVLACLAILVLIIGWFLAAGGLNHLNFDLAQVYDFRDEAKGAFAVAPMNYIAAWGHRVINPFLMVMCLFHRRFGWFVFFFCLQIAFVVIYQEKSVFVPCIYILILYIFAYGPNGQKWFILCQIGIIVVFQILYEVFGDLWGVQYWTRRVYFLGQYFYFNYYETFSAIGHIYMSNNLLSWLYQYPFPLPSSTMVMTYIFGIPAGNPNVGFFASGYMHFGVLGVPAFGVLIGIVLKAFDQMTPTDLPLWFYAGAGASSLMAMLLAQDFFTSMLSGGVAPLFVLLMSMRYYYRKKIE